MQLVLPDILRLVQFTICPPIYVLFAISYSLSLSQNVYPRITVRVWYIVYDRDVHIYVLVLFPRCFVRYLLFPFLFHLKVLRVIRRPILLLCFFMLILRSVWFTNEPCKQ